MSKNKTIIHLTSEVSPFYKRGGLGDIVGALPQYLESKRYHNIVICPFYEGKMRYLNNCTATNRSMKYQGLSYGFKSYYLRKNNIEYYFIRLSDANILSDLESNDGYKPYSAPVNIVPYFYFAKAVLRLIIDCQLSPDYMFCHDWQTGGFFGFTNLNNEIKNNKNFKCLFMIHNYEFQGDLYKDIYKFLERDVVDNLKVIFSRYGSASLLALALKNSDYVATVSHTYAKELINNKVPHIGLKYLDLCNRRILSFLNGIDHSLWKPDNNPFLPISYDIDSLENKKKIKEMIYRRCGFDDPGNMDIPLVLLMARLTPQKGIGLFIDYYNKKHQHCIIDNMKNFLDLGIRLIIYGNPGGGKNGKINTSLSLLQENFPGEFLYINEYSEDLAHQLLAAADILLAPSIFEPCGLVQIYAMAFGTVPVVCAVGGLKDTLRCYLDQPINATGFHIAHFSRKCLFETMREVINIFYQKPSEWRKIVERAMKEDFSWNKMKNQYFNFLNATAEDKEIELEFSTKGTRQK